MKTRWIGSVDGWMGFDGAQYTRALSSPVASELTQHKKHIQFRRCVCVARIAGWLPETGKNIPNKTLLILLVLYVRRKWTQHTHTQIKLVWFWSQFHSLLLCQSRIVVVVVCICVCESVDYVSSSSISCVNRAVEPSKRVMHMSVLCPF